MGRQANAGVTQTRPGGAARDQAAPGFFAGGPQPPGSLHAVAAGSRYASAQLDPQPASAARARRLTRETLTRWDMASLTDDAEIISAEIVANAINAVPPGTTGLAIVYAIHAKLTPLQRVVALPARRRPPVSSLRDLAREVDGGAPFGLGVCAVTVRTLPLTGAGRP
jgi:hypothetical protein